MSIDELIWSHRYADVVKQCHQLLTKNPRDEIAAANLANALMALGRYEEALRIYERVQGLNVADEEMNRGASGRPGKRIDIATLHWCLGDKLKAIHLVRELVDGVLNGSIQYGDIAGGVQQGLLLHYMGVTIRDAEVVAYALKYLRNRAKHPAIQSFPGPVALFLLDEIDFPDLLAAATKRKGAVRDVPSAMEIAQEDLLRRRFVCISLFHDGVKARSRGDDAHCMKRMSECFALENPLIEPEWYLARYEVESH